MALRALAMLSAGIVARNCVGLMNTVVRLAPFHATEAALVKPVPVTVRSKPALPAVIVAGESEVSVGGTGVTVKFS